MIKIFKGVVDGEEWTAIYFCWPAALSLLVGGLMAWFTEMPIFVLAVYVTGAIGGYFYGLPISPRNKRR